MDEPPMSAAAGEQHIQTLRGLERTLLGLPDIVIDDAQLSKLGFRRGTALWNECDVNDLWKDCDTAVPIETPTEPVFFQPLPISYLPGIASQCVEDEMEPMNFCEIQHHGTMCPGWGPSFFSHMNFTASLVLPASRNCWRHVGGTPCFNNKRHAEHGLRYHGGSQHPHVYDRFQHGTFPIWEMTNMCHTNGRPHLITQLGDSSVATGDQVLRSELAVTISAMRHQMTCNGWDRHIVPALCISFGHTHVARVTQFHFDQATGEFVLRQSPLLNIGSKSGDGDRSDEEWADIFTVLRWIKSRPVKGAVRAEV